MHGFTSRSSNRRSARPLRYGVPAAVAGQDVWFRRFFTAANSASADTNMNTDIGAGMGTGEDVIQVSGARVSLTKVTLGGSAHP